MFGLRPLVARVLDFYSDASFFFVLSDAERERGYMLPLASMHITLQIMLRTVLWQHLGSLWPLSGNTKRISGLESRTLDLHARTLATELPPTHK